MHPADATDVAPISQDPLAESGEPASWTLWELASFCLSQPASLLLLFRFYKRSVVCGWHCGPVAWAGGVRRQVGGLL